MRVMLLISAGITMLVACKKSQSLEERWLEQSQRREVIVFRDGVPDPDLDQDKEKSFYFQGRQQSGGQATQESGIYFYTVKGDSLLLRTRQQKFYFKMSGDGKWFRMGRFFTNPGGMDTLLIFEKQ